MAARRVSLPALALAAASAGVSKLLGHESPNTTLTHVKMLKDHLVDVVVAAVQFGALPHRDSGWRALPEDAVAGVAQCAPAPE